MSLSPVCGFRKCYWWATVVVNLDGLSGLFQKDLLYWTVQKMHIAIASPLSVLIPVIRSETSQRLPQIYSGWDCTNDQAVTLFSKGVRYLLTQDKIFHCKCRTNVICIPPPPIFEIMEQKCPNTLASSYSWSRFFEHGFYFHKMFNSLGFLLAPFVEPGDLSLFANVMLPSPGWSTDTECGQKWILLLL